MIEGTQLDETEVPREKSVRKPWRFLRRGGVALALGALAALPLVGLFLRRALPVFRDSADFFLPIAMHTARELVSGNLPLWNPRNFAGEPWLAAVQPLVLYPTTILYLFFPELGDAHRLVLLAHRLLLAVGLYRLGRRIGLDRPASLLAVALACLGTPLASVAGFENNLRTLAWWPWALGAAARGGWVGAGRCGLFLALAFLGGEPELALAVALVSAGILLVAPRAAGEKPGLRLARVLVAASIAFLLSAPTLLPFLELWRQSDRAAGLGAAEAAQQALSWRGVVELMSGPVWGVPDASALPTDRQTYLFVFSLGGAAAALAAAGVLALWRERRSSRPWILAGGLLALLAWLPSLPIGGVLDAIRLPFRFPVRLAVPVALVGVPLAAAHAWSVFRSRGGNGEWRFALGVPVATLAGGLAGGALVLPLLRGVLAAGAAVFLLRLRPSRAIAIALALLAVCETVSLSLLVPTEPAPDRIALVPPGLVERAEMMRPGTRFIADPPAAETLADPRSPVGRFVRSRSLAFGYTNLLGSGASVRGGGPVILSRYDRYLGVAMRPGRYEALLGAMRVGWFLSLRTPPVAGLRPLLSQSGVTLFEWDGCSPRAWIVESWRRADSVAAAAAAIEGVSFDPSKEAVVEGLDGHPVPDPPVGAPSGGQWRLITLIAEEAGRLELRASSSRGGILVVPDAWYPGWVALVDGRETPIFPTDVLFRGIPIPPGQVRVELRYQPESFRIGLRCAGGGALLLLLALVAGWRLDRRRTPEAGA